jgi:ABC-type transport system involved in cytochrome c biogenesis permease subunit
MSATAAPGGFGGIDARVTGREDSRPLVRALHMLASLKLTCVLFLLAMIIVFIGSLAQARRDVWQVMADYFRCYVARVDVQDLFPPSMFGTWGDQFAESLGAFRYLPFPGGWTIGWLMLFNLLAAHALKFRIVAKGRRLQAGVGLIVLGFLMLAAVVITGNQQTGVESGNTVLSANQIWILMLAVLALSGGATVAMGVMGRAASRLSRGVLISLGLSLLAVFLYYVIGGESARLNLSAMRILWQLLKGSAVSLVLLLGSNMLFEKRGGIALLHFGVALLMISELQVGLIAKETNLSLTEGETLNYARDIRERELAILSQRTDGQDDVVVVPESLLEGSVPQEPEQQKPGGKFSDSQRITLSALPFDIAVRRFFRNSELRSLTPEDDTRTADGLGSFAGVELRDPVTGMDDAIDQSTVLIDLISRSSGEVLKSMLVSQNVSELQSSLAEKATVDGKDYYFYLRFQRNYKPYSVTLLDVSRTTYVGSATPRDFRSEIEITDGDAKQRFTLWMNNPLRYKGETFYQSNYVAMPDGKEASTLSVVRNSGWMLPYIACMIVAFGMFAQFGHTLLRFLDRSSRVRRVETAESFAPSLPRSGFAPARTVEPQLPVESPSVLRTWLPIVLTGVCVLWIVRGMQTPKPSTEAMNLYEAAQLPIAWNGRAQPLDSLARTLLLMSSHKSTFEAELEPWQLSSPKVRDAILASVAKGWPEADAGALKEFQGNYPAWIEKVTELTKAESAAVEERLRPLMVRKAPAVHWLLDVMTRPEVAARHRVIRIDDDQVLSNLSLEKRGGMTYSLEEIQKHLQDLEGIWQKGNEKRRLKQEFDLSTLERRVGTLFEAVGRISQIAQVFQPQTSDNLLDGSITAWRILQRLGETKVAMAVPTGTENEQKSWETFVVASALRDVNRELVARNITTAEQFAAYIREDRPLELVRNSVIGTCEILKNTPDPSEAPGAAPLDVSQKAANALLRVEDPYLNRILKLVADAGPGKTSEAIAAGVTKEQAAEIAADRIAMDLFAVISELTENSPDDKRVAQIRQKIQAIGTESTDRIYAVVNEEIARLVWGDLEQSVGPLLNGGEASEKFTKSVNCVTDVLEAWKQSDVEKFNASLTAYREFLNSAALPHVDVSGVRLEAWFNYFEPFQKAIRLYLPIIVLVFLSWLFPLGGAVRRTALFLLVLSFVVHSAALWLRMEISGRPPVTNLYSSAIFIGWAVVIAAYVVELFLKNGIGSLVGASTGAAALMIAHYLALDEGDTLGVMQAVLDTAFWLATHVVCITLGYAATFLAGFLGVGYCGVALAERLSGSYEKAAARGVLKSQVGRMVYGVLCFALFFSLVGTVLGGLWADDSWGRFWGWDPKENGAMLIVLWNALILHARWDKQVGDYGTSVLSMFGNIVTAWSWFGVNELRAGLHSYGFTEGRLLALAAFIFLQLGVMIFFLVVRRSVARQSAVVTG